MRRCCSLNISRISGVTLLIATLPIHVFDFSRAFRSRTNHLTFHDMSRTCHVCRRYHLETPGMGRDRAAVVEHFANYPPNSVNRDQIESTTARRLRLFSARSYVRFLRYRCLKSQNCENTPFPAPYYAHWEHSTDEYKPLIKRPDRGLTNHRECFSIATCYLEIYEFKMSIVSLNTYTTLVCEKNATFLNSQFSTYG